MTFSILHTHSPCSNLCSPCWLSMSIDFDFQKVISQEIPLSSLKKVDKIFISFCNVANIFTKSNLKAHLQYFFVCWMMKYKLFANLLYFASINRGFSYII